MPITIVPIATPNGPNQSNPISTSNPHQPNLTPDQLSTFSNIQTNVYPNAHRKLDLEAKIAANTHTIKAETGKDNSRCGHTIGDVGVNKKMIQTCLEVSEEAKA